MPLVGATVIIIRVHARRYWDVLPVMRASSHSGSWYLRGLDLAGVRILTMWILRSCRVPNVGPSKRETPGPRGCGPGDPQDLRISAAQTCRISDPQERGGSESQECKWSVSLDLEVRGISVLWRLGILILQTFEVVESWWLRISFLHSLEKQGQGGEPLP